MNTDYGKRRREMVERQLAGRGIRNDRVLEAMNSVPRELFVPPEVVEFAYRDTALPIEADQTISQPYIVALMAEELELQPDERVLEVGGGSGYAAAVLSHLAARVFTIERHEILAESARKQIRELGLDSVEVIHGDGTLGLERAAPFDAILVSAGGEKVPPALFEQLAPGGRLLMPVGRAGDVQELVLHRKKPDGTITREALGQVRFVPLIGKIHGEPEESSGEDLQEPERRERARDVEDELREHLKDRKGLVFQEPSAADVAAAAERMAGHEVILLGEASHGTSEFYSIRAEITRELIERGAIDFVAVEADWPDAAHLDRFVRGIDLDEAAMAPFTRFPRWMWANRETLDFLRWLREFNQDIDDPEARVGFFGLDLYSLGTSIQAVLAYLSDVDPEVADLARDRYGCLTPWEKDPQTYGHLAVTGRYEACEDDVVSMLEDLLENRVSYERSDGFRYMNAVNNARLVANAERYYRTMFQGPTASWNLRDQHMFDTLTDLLGYHGKDASAAVWAHNSHLGDASATELSAGGQFNLGQLCRERFGKGCYNLGMGTHRGTVMAAHRWDEPGKVMEVRPSLQGSYEGVGHNVREPGFFLPLREESHVRRSLLDERLQRAIGVIYRPETERQSHYFHASLPRQFDEWLFVDVTSAVTPLKPAAEVEGPEGAEILDTFPFGV